MATYRIGRERGHSFNQSKASPLTIRAELLIDDLPIKVVSQSEEIYEFLISKYSLLLMKFNANFLLCTNNI
jgi:hypothetical protein